MNQFRVIAAVAITGLVGVLPASAQGKAGTHGAGAAAHGRPATTPSGASAGATTHGKSGDAGTAGKRADAGSAGKRADAGARGKSDDAATRGNGKSGSKDASTGRTGINPASGANGLAAKISNNPNQLARVTAMLPQGMTLEQATAGFRNQGQFIAALNASKNQGVPFADLQKAMTVDGLSLGQAVRGLKNTSSTTAGSGATGGSGAPTTTASNAS
jgi:hypothetical protein